MFRRPDFQDDVESVVGDARGTPDISLSAAVDGGVIVCYSFVRPQSPWHIFGGTSESSPLLAGVVAIADQAAGHRLARTPSRQVATTLGHYDEWIRRLAASIGLGGSVDDGEIARSTRPAQQPRSA